LGTYGENSADELNPFLKRDRGAAVQRKKRPSAQNIGRNFSIQHVLAVFRANTKPVSWGKGEGKGGGLKAKEKRFVEVLKRQRRRGEQSLKKSAAGKRLNKPRREGERQ